MKQKQTGRRRIPMSGSRIQTPEEPIRQSTEPLEVRNERLYAAIEATQAFLHKRQSPDEMMAQVRGYYPTPRFFVESNRQSLERTGIGRLDAFYYAMIPALTRTSLSQRHGMKPQLDTLSKMSEYLTALYIGIHVERFYLIILDGRGCLKRSALLQQGGVDSAPFYLEKLLSLALAEEAKYVVLAHNHPGGTRRPSKEDLACTLSALNAFTPLGIPMLDHLIIARNRAVSIRATGLLPDLVWKGVAPNNRFVRGWLDCDPFEEE